MDDDDDDLVDFDSSFNPPAQPELTRQPNAVVENKIKLMKQCHLKHLVK